MPSLSEFQILLVEDLRSDALIFETALKETSSRARVFGCRAARRRSTYFIIAADLQGLRRFNLSSLTCTWAAKMVFRSLGANAYFRKPMSLESFIELVRLLTVYWLDLAELPTPAKLCVAGSAPSEREARYQLPEI